MIRSSHGACAAVAGARAGGRRAAACTRRNVGLAPLRPGQYQDGTRCRRAVPEGARRLAAEWRRRDPDNEVARHGVPIGSFPGGSGLWGLVDWHTAHHTRRPGMIESSWSARVEQDRARRRTVQHVCTATPGQRAAGAAVRRRCTASSQDNWSARYSGWLRIAKAGSYNFGVLHDDGFFFDLRGADGRTASIANDYLNPRNRKSFDSALQLRAGLYAFELGAYEHLEVGVIELSWSRGDGAWEPIPNQHLLAMAT